MKKLALLPLMVLLYHSFMAQSPEKLPELFDIQHYSFSLELNDNTDLIKGEAIITIRFLKNCPEFEIDLHNQDASGKGMVVSTIRSEGKLLKFKQFNEKLMINAAAAAGYTTSYAIHYSGIPSDGLIISRNRYGHRTIFADNWPNRAHNWIPCVDHPGDKSSVEFIVTAPGHYQVISNGLKIEETNLENNLKRTHWRETVPLPTKVMVIGLADFAVNYSGDVDCIPVYSWVYPEDRVNGFYDYGVAVDILPWFIKNVGPYPYRKLSNVQSTTMFGGMENASAIFYSENSITGNRGLESLFAHEIAHQWFGNSATEKNWSDVWLSEGFATYMTHLYMENKYGKDALNIRMKTDRDTVLAYTKKKSAPVVNTSPIYDLMQLLDVNAYQKGGWVLHMLRRELGDALFWKGIQTYYAKYSGRNASTGDLQKVFEIVSGKDLAFFFSQWLYAAGQPDLDVRWRYDTSKSTVEITIVQTQRNPFRFPIDIQVKAGKGEVTRPFIITGRTTTLKIASPAKPDDVILDPDINLLFTAKVRKF